MSWLIVILGFMIMVVLHEAGHFAAAKMVGMRVEAFYLFFKPKLFAKTVGETEYGIGMLPLGGYVKISGMTEEETLELPEEVQGRTYSRAKPWKKIFVIFAGPFVNILIALLIFFVIGLERGAPPQPVIDKVEQSSPAQKAGIEAGDEVVAVNNVEGINGLTEFSDCTGKDCQLEPLSIVVQRQGETQDPVLVTPEYNKQENRPLIGTSFSLEPRGEDFLGSIEYSFNLTWNVTKLTGETIAKLWEKETRDQLGSIVGAAQVTEKEVDNNNASNALFIFGLVSLSLALFNLLPILPLDGGHILMACIEKIKGSAPSMQFMVGYSVLGIGLIMLLFFIGLSNDISRF